MSAIFVEILFILILIAANGIFAMSELAVVSSRKVRLRQWAEAGDRKAGAALELANDPDRFLSTVQVGITLITILTGVFGGATIAEYVEVGLKAFPRIAPYGQAIGHGIAVVGIAYLTLIFGELVPKRLATGHPERIATAVAGPMRRLSVVASPIVRLLSFSTLVVLRLIGVRPSTEPTVTEEEVKAMVKEGARSGIFEQVEHDMVRRIFRLGDRRASALMTPRTELVWLDASDPPEEIRRKITASPHSRFPVCDGSLDIVLGVVHVKDLLVHGFAGQPFDIKGLLTMPLFIYEGKPGLDVLETFKQSGTHIAIVLDEYGSVEGLLTLNDVLEAIVGDMPTEAGSGDQRAVRRHDGSWLMDGMLTTDEFRDLFEPDSLPEGGYETLAGFVMTQLGRIPSVADRFEWDRFRFEVVDMDGNRVDKVLVSRSEAAG